MKRILSIVGVLVIALLVVAATAHAAAGPMPHGASDCLACGFCEWLHALMT